MPCHWGLGEPMKKARGREIGKTMLIEVGKSFATGRETDVVS